MWGNHSRQSLHLLPNATFRWLETGARQNRPASDRALWRVRTETLARPGGWGTGVIGTLPTALVGVERGFGGQAMGSDAAAPDRRLTPYTGGVDPPGSPARPAGLSEPGSCPGRQPGAIGGAPSRRARPPGAGPLRRRAGLRGRVRPDLRRRRAADQDHRARHRVVKRPGRMRWVYTAPERKEFVSDGSKIYTYFPADKQVIVSPAPTGADTTPALFLTGQANIVRDFEASAMQLPGAAAGPSGPQARGPQARSRFRVAGRRGASGQLPDPATGGPRPPGRPLDLHVREPKGKPASGR